MKPDRWDIMVALGAVLVCGGTSYFSPATAIILAGVFFLLFGFIGSAAAATVGKKSDDAKLPTG